MDKFDDTCFGRVASMNDEQFFANDDMEKATVTEERKADQKAVDDVLVGVVEKTPLLDK